MSGFDELFARPIKTSSLDARARLLEVMKSAGKEFELGAILQDKAMDGTDGKPAEAGAALMCALLVHAVLQSPDPQGFIEECIRGLQDAPVSDALAGLQTHLEGRTS